MRFILVYLFFYITFFYFIYILCIYINILYHTITGSPNVALMPYGHTDYSWSSKVTLVTFKVYTHGINFNVALMAYGPKILEFGAMR